MTRRSLQTAVLVIFVPALSHCARPVDDLDGDDVEVSSISATSGKYYSSSQGGTGLQRWQQGWHSGVLQAVPPSGSLLQKQGFQGTKSDEASIHGGKATGGGLGVAKSGDGESHNEDDDEQSESSSGGSDAEQDESSSGSSDDEQDESSSGGSDDEPDESSSGGSDEEQDESSSGGSDDEPDESSSGENHEEQEGTPDESDLDDAEEEIDEAEGEDDDPIGEPIVEIEQPPEVMLRHLSDMLGNSGSVTIALKETKDAAERVKQASSDFKPTLQVLETAGEDVGIAAQKGARRVLSSAKEMQTLRPNSGTKAAKELDDREEVKKRYSVM